MVVPFGRTWSFRLSDTSYEAPSQFHHAGWDCSSAALAHRDEDPEELAVEEVVAEVVEAAAEEAAEQAAVGVAEGASAESLWPLCSMGPMDHDPSA